MVDADGIPAVKADAQWADQWAAALDVEEDGLGGGAVNYHQLLRYETVRNLIPYYTWRIKNYGILNWCHIII